MNARTWMAPLIGMLGLAGLASAGDGGALAHRRTEFAFTVLAPYRAVAPLFGADKERLWAEGWSPRFVHPQPGHDVAGAVFTVEAGHSNVWINTIYDLEQGRVQYACFSGGNMVTLIDIHLEAIARDTTRAVVVYERTALRPEANELVNHLAAADEAKGPSWRAALGAYVDKARAAR